VAGGARIVRLAVLAAIFRAGPGLSRGGLPEVIADQLALLGQELVEVLVYVLLADRFGGQVQILELLEFARPGPFGRLRTLAADRVRRPLRRFGPGLFGRAGRPAGGQQRLERAAGLFLLRNVILRQQVIPVGRVVGGRTVC
jgi:hypothetical protein